MATSAPSAASFPNAAPPLARAGATTGPARSGNALPGAFAPLLDQLGQPSASAASAAPASDAATATALDQPSPQGSPLPSTSLALVALSQTAAALGAPNTQPQAPSSATSQKPGDKKGKPGAVSKADLPTPASAPAATPAPPVPPPASITPLAIPTAAKAAPSTTTSPQSELSISSRTTGQTAIAIRAGQTVDDAGDDDAAQATPQTQSQPATAVAGTRSDTVPFAPPVSSTSLPPASMASAATVAASIVSTRGGPATPVRSSPSDGLSQPSNPVDLVPNLPQPSPSSTAQIPALTSTPPPTAALAVGTALPTQFAPSSPSAPSPATQVAQAIVEPVKVVLTSPAQTGPTTPHVTTIQITPEELGRVEVRIERTNDGPAKIQLIAERPETLSRLVHDQSQLQQALDHAGIPQNSRTIEFSLAPATTGGSASSSPFSGGNSSSGGASDNGFQRQSNPYHNQNLNEPDGSILTSAPQFQTYRSGINITA